MNWLNIYRRRWALFLVLLMLSVSTGVALDMHTCQGVIKSMAIFSDADSCHEVATPCKSACQASSTTHQDKGCCDDVLVVLDLGEEFSLSQDQQDASSDIDFKLEVSATVLTTTQFLVSSNYALRTWEFYSPPQIERDCCVLYQRFLC